MLARYRWSDEAVMRFVNMYKNEPVLWNVTHESYKSKAARFAALKNISSSMQMEDFGVNECRYKIKNLRTHYCQELGKIRNSITTASKPEEVYQPTLIWFTTMDSFLRPFVTQGGDFDGNSMQKRRKFKSESQDTVQYLQYNESHQWVSAEGQAMMEHSVGEKVESNAVGQEIENHSLNQESEDNSYSQGMDSLYVHEDEVHPVSQPTRIVIPKKRKSVNTTVYVDQGYEQFSGFRANVRETEFDLWARSLAVQLNAMETTRALEMQLKIQTLVSQERLAYERKKSVVCQPPSPSESREAEDSLQPQQQPQQQQEQQQQQQL